LRQVETRRHFIPGPHVFTLLVFLHLIATCAAIGTIVITDMRLLAKLMGFRVVLPRPERFETVMKPAALGPPCR